MAQVSTTSDIADVTNTLRARACVEVEGLSVGTDAPGLAPCAGFNSSERAESSSISSTARRVILGGTKETRNALQAGSSTTIDASDMDAFLAAGDQSTAVISARYKPVWEIFYEAFQPDCVEGDRADRARRRPREAGVFGNAVCTPRARAGHRVRRRLHQLDRVATRAPPVPPAEGSQVPARGVTDFLL